MGSGLDILEPIFLNSIFRFVTPILFAALGGALCSQAGITNISLEGHMIMGCFGAVLGSYFFHSVVLGIATAILFSLLAAIIFAFLNVNLGADEIVVGLAVNLFCGGLTVFLLRTIFNVTGTFSDPQIVGLNTIDLPVIKEIPFIGPLLSGHTALVYVSWLCVILIYIFLFNTTAGLQMRGVKEHPEAAKTLGVNVNHVRYTAIILCGVLCGLAGAQLSLGNVTMFVEDMSGGRGWIAIVATMLGQNHPVGVLGASVLFGYVSSISFRIQGLGWPQEFTEMLPYVITIISLIMVYLLSDKKLKRPTAEIQQIKDSQ